MGSLDDLRRARGEGWEWPRIQSEPCPQCRFDPGAIRPLDLGTRLLELSAEWRTLLREADDVGLRSNPQPGVFSPVQYGAHVRDIFQVYGDRILLALSEDNPTIGIFMPEEAVWESYNHLGVEQLADDLESSARRLSGIFAATEPSEWSRTVTRDGGSEGGGVSQFTVIGLMAYSVHEAYHHLLDAEALLKA